MTERRWMPAYMDLHALAYTLSVSPRTIETWVARRMLPPPLETGGKRLWRWKDVEAAMDRLRDPDATAAR